MDAKVTLSFDKDVIEKAKKFAADHHISLSRLTEYLYHQITTGHYLQLEELPIADWVREVAEGRAEYKTNRTSRQNMKDDYLQTRK